MYRVAWWTCALLAAAAARLFERCELAAELHRLGTSEHLATWLCIAYHESRFDTAANNPYSGDHGIFQISELYWCGGGKACGLPCSALRDDSIADDLQCALQIHEEHTRLQGDGFLAWVVYPQHCRGNNKKYLAGCNLRIGTSRNVPRLLPDLNIDNRINNNNRLPSYLTVSAIFNERFGKELDHNKLNTVDWYNYKYDKVDELKLPNLTRYDKVNVPDSGTLVDPNVVEPVSTTSTTRVPPVAVWKYIESDQFRKRITPNTTFAANYTTGYNAPTTPSTTIQDISAPEKYTTSSFISQHTTSVNTKLEDLFASDKYTTYPKDTQLSTSQSLSQTAKTDIFPLQRYTTRPSFSQIEPETTRKSTTPMTQDTSSKVKSTTDSNKSHPSTKPVNANTAYKLAFTTSSTASPVFKFTLPSWSQRTTTIRPVTPSVSQLMQTTTVKQTEKESWNYFETKSTIFNPEINSSTKQKLVTLTPTTSPFNTYTRATQSVTQTPLFTKSTPNERTTPSILQSTSSPQLYIPSKLSLLSTQKNKTPSTRATGKPWFSGFTRESSTKSLQVNTLSSTTEAKTHERTTPSPRKARTRITQSIWDIYLNPTKAPTFRPFNFSLSNNYKLNIFADGTTTAAPSRNKNISLKYS